MPGTLVAIGLNSPRNSAGAFGLRSYMSIWLGPPACQIRITDFRELVEFWRSACSEQARQRQAAEGQAADLQKSFSG